MYDEYIKWAEHETHDWYTAMQNCEQDPIWHAEGDVWTHTKMVMKELCKDPYWEDYTWKEKEILMNAAMFHDVAKPIVTVEKDGRIRSPKHSIIGEILTRELLLKEEYRLKKRESICSLVRYHCKPPNILEHTHPERQVLKLATLCGNAKMLYSLAKADLFGRICDDNDSMLEQINLWKDTAIEMYCFEKPYPWPNDYTRLKFLRDSNFHWLSRIDLEPSCNVHVMCGLPASGKSTVATIMDLPIIELDSIGKELGGSRNSKKSGHIQQIAKTRMKEYLARRQDFIFDATNLIKKSRERWLKLFLDYGAEVHYHCINRNLVRIFKDNSERDDDNRVPEKVMFRMVENMEFPKPDEYHKITYYNLKSGKWD